MTKQFEFRLVGAEAPDGELDADVLVSLVSSLKEIATGISRHETGARPEGRVPNRTRDVARLSIGLGVGSTCLTMHRSGVSDSLQFDTVNERDFDDKFEKLVRAIVAGERPGWAGNSLAVATSHLINALRAAAPEIEFSVDGAHARSFSSATIDDEIWRTAQPPTDSTVHFTGRLYSANLNTGRYGTEDAVGNRVGLPSVSDESVVGLLGQLVHASGVPVWDGAGRLKSIENASIEMLEGDFDEISVMGPVPLDDILSSASGLRMDEGIDLSDEEFESFLEAARG